MRRAVVASLLAVRFPALRKSTICGSTDIEGIVLAGILQVLGIVVALFELGADHFDCGMN